MSSQERKAKKKIAKDIVRAMQDKSYVKPLPDFENEIIRELYTQSLRMPEATIEAIMKIPTDSLERDLRLVIEDSIGRYESMRYHEKTYEPEALVHVLFFAAEKEIFNLVPDILDILSQDEEFVDYYFGDYLTELLWQPFYRFALNDISPLEKFLKKSGVYEFAKVPVLEALAQVYYNNPGKRDDVAEAMIRIKDYCIENSENPEIFDSNLSGNLAIFFRSADAEKYEPHIRQMYDADIVDYSFCGDYEELMSFESDELKQPLPMKEIYPKTVKTWAGYVEETKRLNFPPKSTISKNAPCPCGSGKKYKRCCGMG